MITNEYGDIGSTSDCRTYELCDRCSREIKGGYLEISGSKICGVCQWEKSEEIKGDRFGNRLEQYADKYLDESLRKYY